MTVLARWLEKQMGDRMLNLRTVAAGTGISIGTISDIVRKEHVPKTSTLLRLADYFTPPREQVLSLAAGVPYPLPATEGQRPPGSEDDFLIQQLVAEFRRIPDEWKADALAQLRFLAELAQRPRMRIIGDEGETDEE